MLKEDIFAIIAEEKKYLKWRERCLQLRRVKLLKVHVSQVTQARRLRKQAREQRLDFDARRQQQHEVQVAQEARTRQLWKARVVQAAMARNIRRQQRELEVERAAVRDSWTSWWTAQLRQTLEWRQLKRQRQELEIERAASEVQRLRSSSWPTWAPRWPRSSLPSPAPLPVSNAPWSLQ